MTQLVTLNGETISVDVNDVAFLRRRGSAVTVAITGRDDEIGLIGLVTDILVALDCDLPAMIGRGEYMFLNPVNILEAQIDHGSVNLSFRDRPLETFAYGVMGDIIVPEQRNVISHQISITHHG